MGTHKSAARAAASQKQPNNATKSRGVLTDHSNRDVAQQPPKPSTIDKNVLPPRRRSGRLAQRVTQLSVLETSTVPPPAQARRVKRGRSASAPEERPAKKARRSKEENAPSRTARARSRSQDEEEGAVDRSSTGAETKKRHARSSCRHSTGASSKGVGPRDNFVKQDDYDLRPRHFNHCLFTRAIAPHDLSHEHDILHVPEYVTDIYQRLFVAEETFRVRPTFHESGEINGNTRAILLDWLVEVQHKLGFVAETLHLAINIIDRYTSQVPIPRDQYQLIGITATWIATKYEDIYPPEVKDFVYICDRAYQHQEVISAESEMLRALDFRISAPTAYPFLCRFLTIMEIEPESAVWFGASYYLDRMLQEPEFLCHRPSLFALAAVLLALNNSDLRDHDNMDDELPGLPALLIRYSGFSNDRVLKVATLMAQKVRERAQTTSGRDLLAVYRKYGRRQYLSVSSRFDLPDVDDILQVDGSVAQQT